MSRILVGSTVAVVLALAAAALAEPPELKFQTVTSAAGRFTAKMPGDPKETTEDWADGVQQHRFDVRPSVKMAFHVSYADFKESSVKGKDPHEVLKAIR